MVKNQDKRKSIVGISMVNLLIGNLLGHHKIDEAKAAQLQPKKRHLTLP